MSITINADTVSIISAIIAFVSMIIAIIGAIISGTNLRLQKNIYNESMPGFRVADIVDSYTVYDDSQNTIKLMFFPLIVNTSSKTLILEKIRLHVIGEDETIILCPIIDEKYINDGHSISANTADTKWIGFEMKQIAYKELKVIRHDLFFEDAYKNTKTISTTWLKDMVNNYENN